MLITAEVKQSKTHKDSKENSKTLEHFKLYPRSHIVTERAFILSQKEYATKKAL